MNHPKPTRIGLVKIGAFCASRFLLNHSSVAIRGIFIWNKQEENNMKNMWQLWLTSVLAVFLLAACGGTATEDEPKVDETPKEDIRRR